MQAPSTSAKPCGEGQNACLDERALANQLARGASVPRAPLGRASSPACTSCRRMRRQTWRSQAGRRPGRCWAGTDRSPACLQRDGGIYFINTENKHGRAAAAPGQRGGWETSGHKQPPVPARPAPPPALTLLALAARGEGLAVEGATLRQREVIEQRWLSSHSLAANGRQRWPAAAKPGGAAVHNM